MIIQVPPGCGEGGLMSANDDLRLAWQAHREGRLGRRDALLTLAVAAAEPQGAAWVMPVRDLLVSTRPDHLYSGFYHLDEALADRRVIAALTRLRHTFPPARVRWLVRGADVARGPFSTRKVPVAALVDEMLAPARSHARAVSPPRLGSATPARSATTPDSAAPNLDAAAPILAFYLEVLLAIAALCALVLDEMPDRQRAA